MKGDGRSAGASQEQVQKVAREKEEGDEEVEDADDEAGTYISICVAPFCPSTSPPPPPPPPSLTPSLPTDGLAVQDGVFVACRRRLLASYRKLRRFCRLVLCPPPPCPFT